MIKPDLRISRPESIEDEDLIENDEIAAVQTALRDLADRVSQPFIRACLEQALEDIAHLTSSGAEPDGPVEEAA
jgi:hypothetical protein